MIEKNIKGTRDTTSDPHHLSYVFNKKKTKAVVKAVLSEGLFPKMTSKLATLKTLVDFANR